MERFVEFVPGEFYHVYNRGVEKRTLFEDVSDYQRFQRLLFIRNTAESIAYERVAHKPFQDIKRGPQLVDVIAYALMPNHFHLLVRIRNTTGLSQFMNKLCTSHAMYFNKKYDRTGALLCKPFRCNHIDSDEYFRWVLSYIHLNPLDLDRSQTQLDLLHYPFSSYPDYYDDSIRDEAAILHTDALPFRIDDLEKISTMRSAVA